MELSDIASVSGKGGLFRIINPTRTGAILESLDNVKKKLVVGAQSKVSVLSEISIYTTDADGARPLSDVLMKIHKEFDGDTDLSSGSDPEELKAFLRFILPENRKGEHQSRYHENVFDQGLLGCARENVAKAAAFR